MLRVYSLGPGSWLGLARFCGPVKYFRCAVFYKPWHLPFDNWMFLNRCCKFVPKSCKTLPPFRTLQVPNPATKLICVAQQIATSVESRTSGKIIPFTLSYSFEVCFDFSGNKYEQYV